MLEVRLLGNFEIRCGKKPVEIASRPAQSLFAFLILNAGTAFRREKLAGQLWPDSTEESARDYLRHALWRVRKALHAAAATAYLKADDLTISFDASKEYWLDAAALTALSAQSSLQDIRKAVDAYAGELLPGFYDEWVVLEREHLQSIYEQQMARLLGMMQDKRDWADVLRYAEKWIALGQRPEAAFRYLMSAYAAQGDMAKAATAYERCVKSLAELSVEPSEQTKLLYARLKSGMGTMPVPAVGSKPVRATSITPLGNIPIPLTSFVGRDQELKIIGKLLTSSRLTTLTGPGGVGKTRLAIQAANNSRRRFRDGVYWAGLSGLTDPHLIPHEIAQALRVRETPPEPLIETVKSHLRGKDALLIFDNCEHMIRDCAQYAEELLAACPRLRVLATSIEALGLFNEITWQVPSLPLPARNSALSPDELQQYASIELFQDRARNAKPGFSLTEENKGEVAKICQRLDGIPLAIELAAARMKVLTVEEIAIRLDDRFSLLTSGSRTAIARHQTLRATIDWSHELLSEPERILFRRLAVFIGGFALAAAESVCTDHELKSGDVLDCLGRLVDRSLVLVESDDAAGETRYRLLETIRQYAWEKLLASGEAPLVRQKHVDFFVRFSEQAEPEFYGPAVARWFHRLDSDLDNIRTAIEWATASGRADLSLRILGALVYFWFAHGLVGSEWNDRVQEALARPEGRVRTLERAKALNGIGFMYWADIYPTDQRAELEEALSIAMELDDAPNAAVALRNLGLLEEVHGRYADARTYLERSLEKWEGIGRTGSMGKANTLIFLGDVEFNQGDWPKARSLFEEAAAILSEPGDMNYHAYAVRRLGHLAWLQGDFERARARCEESLRLNLATEDPRGTIASLAGFAAIAAAQARHEHAALLMGAVEGLLEAMSVKLLYVDRKEYERNLALLREKLNSRTLSRLWGRGKALSLDQTIRLALGTA